VAPAPQSLSLTQAAGIAFAPAEQREHLIAAVENGNESIDTGFDNSNKAGVSTKQKERDRHYQQGMMNSIMADNSISLSVQIEQAQQTFDSGIEQYNQRYEQVVAEYGTDEYGAVYDPEGDAALEAARAEHGAAVQQQYEAAGLGAEYEILREGISADGIDYATYREAVDAARDAGLEPSLDDALYEYMLEHDPDHPVMNTLAGDRMANRYNLRAVDELEAAQQAERELAAAPAEPAPEEIIADGARATSGASEYMAEDPELAAARAAAPPMNNQFAAAVTPTNAPQPAPAITPPQPVARLDTLTA
jgi:hypothetical protein